MSSYKETFDSGIMLQRLAVLLPAVALLFVYSCNISGEEHEQSESPEHTGMTNPAESVDEAPEPIGGMSEIYSNLNYPDAAREQNIEGMVTLTFTVDPGGNVQDVEALKNPGGGTAEAAKEAVKATEWEPGRKDGKPVHSSFTLPVRFQLQSN